MLRRQNRANLREKLRIKNLQDILIEEIFRKAEKAEWTPKIPIADVRDYDASINVINGYY